MGRGMICWQPAGAKVRLKLPESEDWRGGFISIQPDFEMGIWELRFSVVKFLFRV